MNEHVIQIHFLPCFACLACWWKDSNIWRGSVAQKFALNRFVFLKLMVKLRLCLDAMVAWQNNGLHWGRRSAIAREININILAQKLCFRAVERFQLCFAALSFLSCYEKGHIYSALDRFTLGKKARKKLGHASIFIYCKVCLRFLGVHNTRDSIKCCIQC